MNKIKTMILWAIISLMMTGCKNNTVETQNGNQNPSISIDNTDEKESDEKNISEEDTSTKDKSTENITPMDDQVKDKDKNVADNDIQLLQGLENWDNIEAAEKFNKVLMMEYVVKEVYSKNTEEAVSRQYLLNEINNLLDYNFEKKLKPNRYAVVDLDQDGLPEIIVSLEEKYEEWILVLRYYQGNIYGYPFVLRGFLSPTVDGTYMASSGAFDSSIMNISFDGYVLKENKLAYSAFTGDTIEYYIGERKVSEEEYNEYSKQFYNTEEVKWYLFPSQYRADYIGEKLFHVDFKAITKPAWEELSSYYSDMVTEATFSGSSKIPQKLIDFILDTMESSKEDESFASLELGTIINQEEYGNLTGINLNGMETVSPVKVDADNDGIDDLVGLFYHGGTGGFSTMELYKASDNGKYIKTSSLECLLQDYKFITYEGKNYLLMKEFDYNTKYYSGYTLYLYENGVLADGIRFSFEIEDYEVDIRHEASSFNGLEQIKNTLTNKNLPKILENNYGVIYGNGEKIQENNNAVYGYSSDIDNDGTVEYYNKSMWFPSNMGTVMQCIYDFENSKVLEDLCHRLSEEVGEARLYTFWVDKVENKNILYLYYGNNLDLTLYAYLLEGSK